MNLCKKIVDVFKAKLASQKSEAWELWEYRAQEEPAWQMPEFDNWASPSYSKQFTTLQSTKEPQEIYNFVFLFGEKWDEPGQREEFITDYQGHDVQLKDRQNTIRQTL